MSASRIQVVDDFAGQYDAWYDTPKGRALLATEIACLRPLLELLPRPYLEVGVGPGRFAEALGIEYGLDPSLRAIERARIRGVAGIWGVGEKLPLQSEVLGGILLAFTLCFVSDAAAVLREAHRVLRPGGGLVLGTLLSGTPWAESYARRGRKGHRWYDVARFYSKEEVRALLGEAGFRMAAFRSTLLQGPGLSSYQVEEPADGCAPTAGFVGIACRRAKPKPTR